MKNLNFRTGTISLLLSILTMPWLALNATWQPPETISNPAAGFVFVGGNVLSMNPQGNAIVIYPGDSLITLQRSIWTNFYVRGNGWQGPRVISNESFITGFPLYVSQGDPDIAINSSNYAFAAWEGLFQGNNAFPEVIISTYRQPNGIWAPVTNVSDTSGDFYSLNANVALNEAGTGVIAYRTTPIANQTIEMVMVSILPLGGAYTTPVQISDVQVAQGNADIKPSVAINDTGDIAVVWFRGYSNSSNRGIDAATYNALTATWSPTIHLDIESLPSAFARNPRVVIDPAGNAVAVWNLSGEIRSSVFTPGVGWATYQVVATGASSGDNPAIVTDKSGNVTITWGGSNGGIFAAYKPFGGAWSAPQVISTDPTARQDPFMSQKPLAVDPDGNVMTIWQINNIEYQTSYRLVGQPWSAPENLDMGVSTVENSFPNVGLASCGFAAASFNDQENELIIGEINENYFAPVGLSQTECVEKFASQKVQLDILKWLPFSDCILSYNVYCNGVLIASIPSTGPFEFINPSCNNCTYTLTTTNIWGYESDPVPFTL